MIALNTFVPYLLAGRGHITGSEGTLRTPGFDSHLCHRPTEKARHFTVLPICKIQILIVSCFAKYFELY